MDYREIRDRRLRPVHTGPPADLTDDPRRWFLRPVPCTVCGGSGTQMNYWEGEAEEWGCGTCAVTGNAPDAPVDAEPSPDHVAALADCPAFRDAEAAARDCADLLAAWEVTVPDRIVWRVGLRREPRIGSTYEIALPAAVRDAVRRCVDAIRYEVLRIDLGIGRWSAGHLGNLQTLADAHTEWAEAGRRNLVAPPEGVPARIAGRPVADVPNPFTPLLEVWRTGFVPERIDHTGMHLYAPRRDAIVAD